MSASASCVSPSKNGTRASCISRSVTGTSGVAMGMADTCTAQSTRAWWLFSVRIVQRHPPFGVEGGHAPAAGGGHRLPVGEVLHVPAGKDAGDVRVGAARAGPDVAVVVQV